MQNFANDFVRQTNLLIGEPAAFDNGVAPPLPALFAAPVVAEEQKKERKKRTHDPNAPKRPLTPYFLYMQTARPIIASDLGSEAPKGAVQEEGQRRWAQMTPQEKTAWNNAYQFNLRMYNARVHSYKAGNGGARDMSDEEALRYADENGLPPAELASDEPVVANDQDAIAEQLQMAAPAMPVAPVQEEAKTPKAKVTRKRKSAAADTATPASPVSKRKRQSKAAETVEEPKKSSRKKKNA
ncbi:hypothetical protein GGR56DRAFT_547367 [Xylariaceae sp. FL0804]|nr:hypothetical protein GGR56DRAFT_547367 [Xylariaceae sp. FL0804]